MAKKEPTVPSRKRGAKLDPTQVSSVVSMLVKDAEDFIDSTLAPERTLMTNFYNGDPFGDEEEGRSQIVMTEVRDVVQAMLPSLLRVFLSTENIVEYVPRRADSVESAAQATDYANYIFYIENHGAQQLWNVFKDALIRKTGITRWYPNTKTTVTEEDYKEITDDQLLVLENDPALELVELQEIMPTGFSQTDPMTGEPVMEPAIYDATFRRTVVDQKFIIESIPTDEFLIARNARSEDDAELIGVRKDMLVSDLVAMGYDEDEIMEHGGPQSVLDQNQEAHARNPALRSKSLQDAQNIDPSMARVRYYDVLVRMDGDGDGVAELHHICAIGTNGAHILHDKIVSDVNYAIFCPDPEPHTAIGHSIAEQVADLQLIKSHIVRNTLDSLAQAIHPRTAVVEGMVNLDDVLNTEMGAVIRMRQIGAVQELNTTFVGQQALPVLGYLDDIRAQRTGISRATQGLDADVLQSTTKAAVTATVTAAQERLEMVARVLADGGMKRMFRGILKMIVQNQDKARTVRLRGKWVDVNPAAWDADMDVITNVGLGLGDRNEKIAVLTQVSLAQKETLTTLGPDNVLTDVGKYRGTLGKLLELTGIKDVDTYWKEVTPESIQQFQQTLAENKKPSPEEVLAQIEARKTDADILIKKAELTLKEREIRLRDDRERDKNEMEAFLKATEIAAKYGTAVDMAQLQNIADKQRLAVETAMKIADSQAQAEQPQEV